MALAVVDSLEAVEVECDQRERAAAPVGLVELRLEPLQEPTAVQAAGERIGSRDSVELVALGVADARLPRADQGGDAEAHGEQRQRQVVAAADVHRDHQVHEQLERADREHEHRRIGQRGDNERDEEQGGEGAVRATVDRHGGADSGNLGEAPAEEEEVMGRAVDDLLERQQAHEHSPGQVGAGDGREPELVGALPSAHRVGGEHRGGQVGEPDPRARDAQAELDLREIDDLKAEIAHDPPIGADVLAF